MGRLEQGTRAVRAGAHVAGCLPDFIEVEIGTFCNRRCRWCPNGWHERGRQHDRMATRTWRRLLADLRRAEYAGWLAFHNYNEPLADPTLREKVDQARRALPRARLAVYTNGDLLDRAMLDALVRAPHGSPPGALGPTTSRDPPALTVRHCVRAPIAPGWRG